MKCFSQTATISLSNSIGESSYETKDHRSNVYEVVSDRKTNKNNQFQGVIIAATDYYPYGSEVGARSFSSDSYKYGFQGQEKDEEAKGKGNSINYKYRMHDTRAGRFFAVDPLSSKYPHNSNYAFSENRLIDGAELEGLEVEIKNRLGIVTNFGNLKSGFGIKYSRTEKIGSNTISFNTSLHHYFIAEGTGKPKTELSVGYDVSVGISGKSMKNKTGKNNSFSFGSTLYLNNNGTSQRAGKIGANVGDFSVSFEDDFIPSAVLSLINWELMNNPLLSDGMDRFTRTAHLEMGYNDGNISLHGGIQVASGEPKGQEGSKDGFLGTALLDKNDRVVMGKHKNMAMGNAYFGFGYQGKKLSLGYDSNAIQDWFQNGFHGLAGMNLLNMVSKEKRNTNEGITIQLEQEN